MCNVYTFLHVPTGVKDSGDTMETIANLKHEVRHVSTGLLYSIYQQAVMLSVHIQIFYLN